MRDGRAIIDKQLKQDREREGERENEREREGKRNKDIYVERERRKRALIKTVETRIFVYDITLHNISIYLSIFYIDFMIKMIDFMTLPMYSILISIFPLFSLSICLPVSLSFAVSLFYFLSLSLIISALSLFVFFSLSYCLSVSLYLRD